MSDGELVFEAASSSAASSGKAEKEEKESSTVLSIGYAPSNRASCKDSKCLKADGGSDKKIAKGEIRISKTFDVAKEGAEMSMSHQHHVECFLLSMMPRSRGWKITSIEQFEGHGDLSVEDRTKVIGIIAEAQTAPKPQSGGKRKAKEEVEGGGGEEAAPLAKAGGGGAAKPKKAAKVAKAEGEDAVEVVETKPAKKRSKKAKKEEGDD